MDRDRWPDAIVSFVESVTCPKCGTAKADGVLVTVRYQAPVWNVVGNCLRCRFVHLWQHLGLEPKPVAPKEEASVPLPSWVSNL